MAWSVRVLPLHTRVAKLTPCSNLKDNISLHLDHRMDRESGLPLRFPRVRAPAQTVTAQEP